VGVGWFSCYGPNFGRIFGRIVTVEIFGVDRSVLIELLRILEQLWQPNDWGDQSLVELSS
jgi:hypothetical protein